MTKQLFGTDGIRGLPGEFPLDDATLDRVGMALGEYVSAHGRTPRDRPRVLIGRDTRESGPHIAERIARGLAAAGVEPISAGVLTTPGVAWLVNREGFAAGVVISASHNPYHDNGVKLISATGMKFPDAVEGELERFILSSNEPAEARNAMQIHDNEKIDDDYLEGLRAAVPRDGLRERRIEQAGSAAVSFAGGRGDCHREHSRRKKYQCRLRIAASRRNAEARGGNRFGDGSGF